MIVSLRLEVLVAWMSALSCFATRSLTAISFARSASTCAYSGAILPK
jgi:hypothetical protein